ncbi:hypothetical protein [Paraburkholderia sediminicola]|uniref:hypothetical protein n=1 Tax=Paraburkholderia sediminicola TaxID=458836 RepID=UPI0038BD0BB1
MTDYFLPCKETVKRIDELCTGLFELWCEERKRVPLAYLLHCWPLTGHDLPAIKRLADAMSDLCQFQAGKITKREWSMMRELIGSAREIVGEPVPRGAATANGVGITWMRARLANAADQVSAVAVADILAGPL